jgi:hypothetical protein
MAARHAKLLLIVVAAWVSSITMLQPWPTTAIAFVSAYNYDGPHWQIWACWALNALFVLGGTVSAFLAYRGSERAFKYALAFSVLYIAYWLSEYVLARNGALFIVSLVLRQLRENELLSKLVIAQHQIVLPIVHLTFLVSAVFRYGRRRHAV